MKMVPMAIAGVLACAGLLSPAAAQTATPVTRLVTEGGNRSSSSCDVASEGRAVAFASRASNLVEGDANRAWDVFRETAKGIERMSVTSREKPSVVDSYRPSISDDGNRVAFTANRWRLQGGRRPEGIFVRDAAAGKTIRVNVTADGSRPDSYSDGGVISGNGRHVAFFSYASNLVEGGVNEAWTDAYVRSLARGKTKRVSFALGGGEPEGESYPYDLSARGGFVVFTSDAPDIVSGDGNRAVDVFRHNVSTGRTTRISVASDGSEGGLDEDSGSPSISADGRFVAFVSAASLDPDRPTDHPAVYVHDAFTAKTSLVSLGSGGIANSYSDEAAISADGRYVAFLSAADNLVPHDTNAHYERSLGVDGFVRDLVDEQTFRVTVGEGGQEGNDDAGDLSLSPDGGYVCWSSRADNLVSGDDNGRADVFVRGPLWEE
ncbi:MAG TPA: hypothetical protein VHN37_01110 [Actinomycetota bacterium]|nr:hypothetical protein [Actinomycetota bacterium]